MTETLIPQPRTHHECAYIRTLGGRQYQAYLDAGYREWFSVTFHATPYLLQKACYDSDGERCFFINVSVWDFADHRPENPVAYEPEVQYNSHQSDGGPTFRVTLWPGDMTPGEVEAFFWNIYDKLGVQPYGD